MSETLKVRELIKELEQYRYQDDRIIVSAMGRKHIIIGARRITKEKHFGLARTLVIDTETI